MYDLRRIASTLDLWGCMWLAEERQSFETALVRALTDEQPYPVRLDAWVACSVLGCERLTAAANCLAARGTFISSDLRAAERAAVPVRRAFARAEVISRNLSEV